MDLAIEPASEPGIAEAARRALAQAGLELQPHAISGRGEWWRAGLTDAIERAPADPPAFYDAAPWRRSMRGATRA